MIKREHLCFCETYVLDRGDRQWPGELAGGKSDLRETKRYFQDVPLLHRTPPPLYLNAEVAFDCTPENGFSELPSSWQGDRKQCV